MDIYSLENRSLLLVHLIRSMKYGAVCMQLALVIRSLANSCWAEDPVPWDVRGACKLTILH